jgi:hypothetical protein
VKTKDYLGKAKLVAAADAADAFTTFTGVTRLKQGIAPGMQFVEPESAAAQLTRSKTMAAKKVQLDVATEGVRVGGALGRAKTLAAKRAEAGKGGSGGNVAFADLPRVSLSDGPVRSEPEPMQETPKSALGRSATSGGARGPPLRSLSVRKPGAGEGGAPQREELAARVERLRMDDLPAPGGGRGPGSAGGRGSPASASGRAVGFSPTPPLSVSKGGWRGAEQDAGSRRTPDDAPRMTEFYDDYLDSYTRDEEEEAQPPADARIAAWARSSGRSPTAAGGRGSPSAPGSQFGGSNGGGSMRRKLTRRPTGRSRMSYYEEEEGYESGEYDEPVMYELVKVRVKVRFLDLIS